jgi:putative ABC transport system permease protein
MLKHYIIIAWRSIVRNKFYSLILTSGLALGIASSLLLGMYTWHELTYDTFHEHKERIFLVGVDSKEGTEEYRSGWTTPPTGPALVDYFPEIENFTRLAFWFDDIVVTRNDRKFAETSMIGADSSIFKIFTIPFLAGNPETALTEPNSIVITKEIAQKYFGDEDPMGQTLHFDHFFAECKVTGIVNNYPDNSHFDFGILLSLSSFKAINFDFENSWRNHTFSTYVLLSPHANAVEVESKMQGFIKRHLDPYLIQRYQQSYDEMYKEGDHYKLFLAPLKEIHLSTLVHENQEGKKALVYALGLIGIMIIILVCINYTNLATVLSLSRTREVGIRKASGSKSSALCKQFLTESVIIAFAGLFIGLGLVESFTPFFNNLTKQSLHLDYLNPHVAAGLLIFALLIGLLAGIYPALTFASFNPIRALKGSAIVTGNSRWLRNGLVIFQFTICVIMTVSTLVVYKQLSYMAKKNVGFAKDQVVVVKRVEGLKTNKTVFKNELKRSAGILSASYTETTPGRNFNGHTQHFAGQPLTETPVIYPFFADADIFETLDIELVRGVPFTDSEGHRFSAVLNETAVKLLGLERPLEEKIDQGTRGAQVVDVIGVVKDFHFRSFHHQIEPLVIFPLDVENDPYHNTTFMVVRVNGLNIPATLQYIEDQWKKFAGNYPFEYSFMDEDFNKLFEREHTMAKVYTIFSVISISIACLGLLGLTSYFASKRTKEIGIRKIVGASITNIALLLSRQFINWLVVSIVIGSAVSWYLMRLWLQNFAYQTQMDSWIFVLSAISVLMIALLTVSWHLYRAASRNPVETLRYE